MKENGKCISDKKQIRFILTQNGNAIPVHFKFFRVYKRTSKAHFLCEALTEPKSTLTIWWIGDIQLTNVFIACLFISQSMLYRSFQQKWEPELDAKLK